MLEYLIENTEGLDEPVAALYKQTERGYELQVDLSTSGMKATLDKVKTERNDLKTKYAQVSKFESLLNVDGFDPESVQDLMEKAKDYKEPEDIADLKRQHQKQVDQLAGERDQAKSLADQEKGKTNDYIKRSEFLSVAPGMGVLPEAVEIAYKAAEANLKLDDNQKVVVVDSDGDPTQQTPSEYISQNLKQAMPFLFKPNGTRGSNSKNGNPPNSNNEALTANQMIAQGLEQRN